MQQDQNNQQRQFTNSDALGIVFFAANVLATSVAVFLRRGFGREALGWNSLVAFFLLLFLGAADPAFGYFAIAFTFAQVFRRVETFRLLRGGAVLHSQYAGFPYWAMKLPFVKSEKAAREAVEPLICLVVGVLLCPLSENIGGYVMLCGVGFIARYCIEELVMRKRVERMHDARIEHEWYSNQMRR